MGRISTEYAAGFFDGEGSIAVCKAYGRVYRVQVSISQDVPDPLWAIKERWGGYISVRPPRANGKRAHYWKIDDRRAKQFLEDIFPFLLVKKASAALVLTFWDKPDDLRTRRHGRLPLSNEEFERRVAIREGLRVLNARKRGQ